MFSLNNNIIIIVKVYNYQDIFSVNIKERTVLWHVQASVAAAFFFGVPEWILDVADTEHMLPSIFFPHDVCVQTAARLHLTYKIMILIIATYVRKLSIK